MNKKTDFSKFNNSWYSKNQSILIRSLWFAISAIIFKGNLIPFYLPKIFLLRLFGAKLGSNCVIKPCVNIKYPWNLRMGNHVWIGEQVWIDNLSEVLIGNDVCISQGSILITGSHDYKRVGFDLITKKIILEDGVWLCANSVVPPGVICRTHSILSIGSVANNELEAYGIYKGNPAIKIKNRIIEGGE